MVDVAGSGCGGRVGRRSGREEADGRRRWGSDAVRLASGPGPTERGTRHIYRTHRGVSKLVRLARRVMGAPRGALPALVASHDLSGAACSSLTQT